MGTQAHWMSHRWRIREVTHEDGRMDVTSPVYCETVADAKAEAEKAWGAVVLERRTGTKASGYVYVFDRFLYAPEPSVCAVPGCGRPITLMERKATVAGWGDSTRDPFYCPHAANLTHRPTLPVVIPEEIR